MIACWWPCGGSAGDDVPGRLGWSIPRVGFAPIAEFVSRFVVPRMRDLGVPPRLFLHNPFGLWPEKTGTQMTIHQERLAEADDALELAVSSFKPAFLPLVKSGVEVVAYIGPDVNASTARPVTRWNHLHANLNRILATGCSVAFDMVGVWTTADVTRCEPRLLRLLESLGVKVYAEGAPVREEWNDVPIIIDTTSSDAWQGVRPRERQAETILRVNPSVSFSDQITIAQAFAQAGFVPAVEPLAFVEQGAELVERLRSNNQ